MKINKFFYINITKIFLVFLWMCISLPIMSGGINSGRENVSPTVVNVFNNTFEPFDDRDFFYEDNSLIVWFDYSSGGFPRGFWLKKDGEPLKALNTNGQLVPVNLTFGGGYQLLVACGNRPDSPTENFTIFNENNPRPALSGDNYIISEKDFTQIGFVGSLYNQVISTENGFDPNLMEITPDRLVKNLYANDSWDKSIEYWVHTKTDEITKKRYYEKVSGTGEKKTISYRIVFKICHDKLKIETNVDTFLSNKPNIYALLVVLDTWEDYAPSGNDFVKKLGVTGFKGASWNVKEYDHWLGIPPSSVKKFKTSEISHVMPTEGEYAGNGATSFVAFRDNLVSNWIKFENRSENSSGVKIGINASMKRELKDISQISHIGFTGTPWYENGRLGYWWNTSEVAFTLDGTNKDNLVTKSLKEEITFKIGN